MDREARIERAAMEQLLQFFGFEQLCPAVWRSEGGIRVELGSSGLGPTEFCIACPDQSPGTGVVFGSGTRELRQQITQCLGSGIA